MGYGRKKLQLTLYTFEKLFYKFKDLRRCGHPLGELSPLAKLVGERPNERRRCGLHACK